LKKGDSRTKKTFSLILSSWLRVIRRCVVSYWLLIVIFSSLAAYLTFPSPLDPLSFALWPEPESGPPLQGIVQLSYTVLGNTTYPGVVDLNISVTNKDSIVHDFVVFAVIGSTADRLWYGPGFYRDNLSPATDVQFAPDPWYSQAFISTGPLGPGLTFQVTRKIEIPNDPLIKDTLVDVRDKLDASRALAFDLKRNVINRGK
jgi:hypothetical protein